jgi:hypothetical protein
MVPFRRNDSPGPSADKGIEGGEVIRRREITVEREFLSIRSTPEHSFTADCPYCGHEVQMLSADAAALAVQTTTRAIHRWVEEGRLHFIEPGSGRLFVCSKSLQQLSSTPQIPSGESQ